MNLYNNSPGTYCKRLNKDNVAQSSQNARWTFLPPDVPSVRIQLYWRIANPTLKENNVRKKQEKRNPRLNASLHTSVRVACFFVVAHCLTSGLKRYLSNRASRISREAQLERIHVISADARVSFLLPDGYNVFLTDELISRSSTLRKAITAAECSVQHSFFLSECIYSCLLGAVPRSPEGCSTTGFNQPVASNAQVVKCLQVCQSASDTVTSTGETYFTNVLQGIIDVQDLKTVQAAVHSSLSSCKYTLFLALEDIQCRHGGGDSEFVCSCVSLQLGSVSISLFCPFVYHRLVHTISTATYLKNSVCRQQISLMTRCLSECYSSMLATASSPLTRCECTTERLN